MKKFPSDISNEQIKDLPLIYFPGHIHVIDSAEKVGFAYQRLKNAQILGFDTETRPAFRKGQSYSLSLVQLATEKDCFLFRINMISFPQELREILENEKIIKVGFDLSSDFHQLRRKVKDITPKGFVDLQKYAKEFGLKNMSLKKLTAILLGHRLSKRQRLSNWEQRRLTEGQLVYAATDAWVTLILYKKLRDLSGKA